MNQAKNEQKEQHSIYIYICLYTQKNQTCVHSVMLTSGIGTTMSKHTMCSFLSVVRSEALHGTQVLPIALNARLLIAGDTGCEF